MKKNILLITMVAFSVFSIYAEGFRSITTADYTTYFQDDYDFIPEEVFLATILPGLMAEARISAEITENWQRWLGQAGIVYVIMDGLYTELVYGGGTYDSGNVYQQGFWELTFESTTLVAAVRIKFHYENESGNYYFLPYVYAQYPFTAKLAAKLKYSISWDNEGDVSHGVNLEGQVKWNEKIQTDLVIGGTYRQETLYDDSQVLYYLYEFGGRFTLAITPTIKIKLFENVLIDEDLGTGLQSVLTLDVSF